MTDTKDYIVTALAGPKVAGVAAETGHVLTLTEPEARSELLAGAIVLKKGDGKEPAADAVFKTTKALADIQARAIGRESAKVEGPAEPIDPAGDPPPPPPPPPPGVKQTSKAV